MPVLPFRGSALSKVSTQPKNQREKVLSFFTTISHSPALVLSHKPAPYQEVDKKILVCFFQLEEAFFYTTYIFYKAMF